MTSVNINMNFDFLDTYQPSWVCCFPTTTRPERDANERKDVKLVALVLATIAMESLSHNWEISGSDKYTVWHRITFPNSVVDDMGNDDQLFRTAIKVTDFVYTRQEFATNAQWKEATIPIIRSIRKQTRYFLQQMLTQKQRTSPYPFEFSVPKPLSVRYNMYRWYKPVRGWEQRFSVDLCSACNESQERITNVSKHLADTEVYWNKIDELHDQILEDYARYDNEV